MHLLGGICGLIFGFVVRKNEWSMLARLIERMNIRFLFFSFETNYIVIVVFPTPTFCICIHPSSVISPITFATYQCAVAVCNKFSTSVSSQTKA
jgi:hypothetical protein